MTCDFPAGQGCAKTTPKRSAWCHPCLLAALETAERDNAALNDRLREWRGRGKAAEHDNARLHAALETAERELEARIVVWLRAHKSDLHMVASEHAGNLADAIERGDHRKGSGDGK